MTYLTEENVNGESFETFVSTCLLPQLMPFDGVNHHSVLIMDNCCAPSGKNNSNDSQHRCTSEISTAI